MTLKTDVYGCGETAVALYEQQQSEPEPDYDVVVAVIDRITNIQANIDKIVVRACADLREKREYLDYLQTTWQPHIDKLQDKLKPKQQTLKLGSAGIVQWERTGGFYVKDREELAAALAEMTDEQLKAFGAERKVSFDSEKVLKEIAVTGEALPGVGYLEAKEHGRFRIGANKPWSPNNLKTLLGKALAGKSSSEQECGYTP